MVIASACVTLLAHRIDRAICGRLSAFQAVRQVVQKHVGAVRWRHRACTSSAAVVAVGASCATAMAEGRTRPGVSVPRASGVIMSQPLDESRSDCPSSTLQVHAAMANALSMASAGAAGSVLLRQSRGKRPSRWRVITPGARRGTDTPGRVRPSHCSGAAGANSNHSC